MCPLFFFFLEWISVPLKKIKSFVWLWIYRGDDDIALSMLNIITPVYRPPLVIREREQQNSHLSKNAVNVAV